MQGGLAGAPELARLRSGRPDRPGCSGIVGINGQHEPPFLRDREPTLLVDTLPDRVLYASSTFGVFSTLN
jgi:hypothetical protein